MVCTLVAMPIPLVGHYPNVVYIYNDSAMKNMYRLNVDIPTSKKTRKSMNEFGLKLANLYIFIQLSIYELDI
jgi:hypothetical protein